MEKTCTTPLHPQSHGLVERFNRTLARQLAIFTADHQRDWDTHLPFILMAHRSAVQDSRLCTPALHMMGREHRTPQSCCSGSPQTHRLYQLDQSMQGSCRRSSAGSGGRVHSEFGSESSELYFMYGMGCSQNSNPAVF